MLFSPSVCVPHFSLFFSWIFLRSFLSVFWPYNKVHAEFTRLHPASHFLFCDLTRLSLFYIQAKNIDPDQHDICSYLVNSLRPNALYSVYIQLYMQSAFDLIVDVKSKLLSAISRRRKTPAKAISHLQKRWSVTAARTPHCSSRQPRRYSPPSGVQLRDVVATWPFLSCPCLILAMFYLLCSETGVRRRHCIPLISSKQKGFL